MTYQEDRDVAARRAEPPGPAVMGISVLAATVVLLVGALVEIGIAQVCSRTEYGGRLPTRYQMTYWHLLSDERALLEGARMAALSS